MSEKNVPSPSTLKNLESHQTSPKLTRYFRGWSVGSRKKRLRGGVLELLIEGPNAGAQAAKSLLAAWWRFGICTPALSLRELTLAVPRDSGGLPRERGSVRGFRDGRTARDIAWRRRRRACFWDRSVSAGQVPKQCEAMDALKAQGGMAMKNLASEGQELLRNTPRAVHYSVTGGMRRLQTEGVESIKVRTSA